MTTIGASIVAVEAGRVELSLPYSPHITQQHGFVHGGIIATVLDSACGYAAATLMPAEAGVLTIEFKTNLLAPAKGERFVAIGNVLRAGRTITVTFGEAFAIEGSSRKLIATMMATMMTVTGNAAVKG